MGGRKASKSKGSSATHAKDQRNKSNKSDDTVATQQLDVSTGPSSWTITFLACAVALPYMPSLRHAFVGKQDFLHYDDTQNFRDNAFVHGLSVANIKWVLEDGVVLGVYEPVSWLLKMSVTSLSGIVVGSGTSPELEDILGARPPAPSASAFAIVGVLLHVAVAVAAYIVWRCIVFAFLQGGGRTGAVTPTIGCPRRLDWSIFLSAIVVGVHPLRVEGVRWLSAHGYPLSSLLALASLYLHVKATLAQPSSAKEPSAWFVAGARRIGSCVLLLFAVLSKASCVTVPLVHFFVTIALLGKCGEKSKGATSIWNFAKKVLSSSVVACVPFFGISITGVILAVRAAAADPQPMITHKGVGICVQGLMPRLLRAALALEHYIAKTLLPIGLKYRYYAPEDLSFANPRCVAVASTVALGTLCLLICAAVKTARAASSWEATADQVVERCWVWWSLVAGWATYLGLLLPTLGIYGDHVCSMASDRYTYLPHFAVCVPSLAALVEFMSVAAASLSKTWGENADMKAARRTPLSHLALGFIACALGCETAVHTCSPWSSSEALWQHAIAVDPDDEKAYLNLATTISTNHPQRLSEAIKLYEKAIGLNPLESEAYSNMGVLLAATGRNGEAEATLSHALKLDPTHWQVRGNYGKALEGNGKFDEARRIYEQALQSMNRPMEPPTEGSSWTPATKAAAVKGDYEALPRSEIAFNLAELNRRSGKAQETSKALLRVLEINPRHTGALLNLGNKRLEEARRRETSSQRRKAKMEEAISFYTRIIEYNPTYALAYSQLGTARHMSGDAPGAIALMKQAVILEPTFANAWFKLAHSSYQIGDWPAAREGYIRVTELDPTRMDAFLNLGIGAKEHGDAALTIKAFKAVVAIDPKQAEVWYYLGQMRLLTGAIQEAKDAFEKAAALDPAIAVQVEMDLAEAEVQARERSNLPKRMPSVQGSIQKDGYIDL